MLIILSLISIGCPTLDSPSQKWGSTRLRSTDDTPNCWEGFVLTAQLLESVSSITGGRGTYFQCEGVYGEARSPEQSHSVSQSYDSLDIG